MKVYRLEAVRADGAPHLFPRAFPTIEAAASYAENVIDILAVHPAWKVRALRVKDVSSSTVVHTVFWHDPETDPDPFAPTEGALA